ncbi:hypothetical protein [Streptosporangium carneum]|uniref:Uncharacterized protein n=1 Tax=Streptosporangium carneum TaxID=47481 RepID=A0A9W6HW20_9ACTN|nr:hypothetical protein [Streptosporangium carneum]GLK07381.1 hypothetical protein GCM10017600_07860 [Streptosporangium carneum]
MTEVGVLLPLRIETRFSGSRLCLRVVPDEPWLTRHDPRPTEAEMTALQRYAQQVDRAAWNEFATAVGAPRAAFLVRTYMPEGAVIDPGELRVRPVFPRISSFPTELLVWLASGGGAPRHVLTLQVDHDRLTIEPYDPDNLSVVRWWEDWEEAKLAGLAGEIELDGNGDDIDLLVVTGLGQGMPRTLFGDHRDAGSLGLIALGTATNSVDGTPAANLAQDADTWFDLLHALPTDNDRTISMALTGDPDALGALPGPPGQHFSDSTAMVGALWPALWGFAATDVWGLPLAAEAAAWARQALFPEGPFPVLRVGSQPYGLLPATALSRWIADADDVEAALIRPLMLLREQWQAAAEGRGTAAGASAEELLDLIGHVPSAPGYRHRRAFPLELWWLSLLLLGADVSWTEFDEAWRDDHPLSAELGLDPTRRYGARGRSRPLALPLVVPAELPANRTVTDVLKQLVELAHRNPTTFQSIELLEEAFLRFRPASLLLRLVIRALQVAIGDVGREALGDTTPGPEPVARPFTEPGRLEHWINRTTQALVSGATPAAHAFQMVAKSIEQLADIPEDRLERLLRATVDTALYRLDPWLLGPPTRRLQTLLDAGVEPVLGAYGWVDAPRPGSPGPTSAGLLHAPSPGQALTATVLRDRAVSDPEPSRWHMDLTSRTVREAARIGEHVRLGAHLAEALGREVERIAGSRALVDQLRDQFRLRTEHAGRRVCDGLAVLATDPAGLGFSAQQRAQLEELRAAVNAYGDLLVAEAVHHVTQGRATVAGAAMDAAAGLSRPPELEVIRTPRQGRAVATSVLVLIPDAAAPPEPADNFARAEQSPIEIADPAVARFVATQAGEAIDWVWTAGSSSVTLADLGLGPADALTLSRTELERLATDALGDIDSFDGFDGSERYEAAVRLVGLLGRSPAEPDAITTRPGKPTGPSGIEDDLRGRYLRLLRTSEVLTDLLGTVTDATALERLLLACRRWGILTNSPLMARELLLARRAMAPSAQQLDRDGLLEAITALVCPTGQLALLSRPDGLPSFAQADLDLEWLTVVAAVRPALARLEVHQFLARQPLQAWATKPTDPWQSGPANTERLVVAYGPPTLDQVAATVIDRWTEVIPDTEHTTAAAFGFDAPAARAPQAILLAVPPDSGGSLDPATLLDVIVETRQLAHARMARPADLDPQLRGLLPTALLPAAGRIETFLDPQG